MNTRAKFTCTSVRKYKGWNGTSPFLYEAEFSAVTGDSEENKSFFGSTPTGSIKIATIREDHFEPGKSYYIDFIEAQ